MLQPQPFNPQHLTIQQAAKRHSASERTVKRWIAQHGLPVIQVVPGGRVLIAVSDLDEFLAAHRRESMTLEQLATQAFEELKHGRRSNRKKGSRHDSVRTAS